MGASIYPPPVSEPSTIVALQNIEAIPSTAYVVDETIQFTQTFTAKANRHYKVTFLMANIDTDGTTGSSYISKSAGVTTCRHNPGSTVSLSSNDIGQMFTAVFGDDSMRNSGVNATWWIESPPAGLNTVAITLKASLTTAGGVRYLAYGNGNRLAIEDAGPAV
ncbi:hypothetical protein [Streptomyces phage phiScoe55]|nr:hypothetical protein [Streptomyces phage phiScoe55]